MEEYTDDESSYEIIDWKEFCITDSDKESEPPNDEPQSSDLESNDDCVLDLFDLHLDEVLAYRTVAYQKVCANVFHHPSPSQISQNNSEIKDVVKDHVLPFLPAKSLMRFRTVSKDWDRWIASPFLAHQQSYLFQDVSGFFCQSVTSAPTFIPLNWPAHGIPSPSLHFFPESVEIKSSCNGLLLCQGLSTRGENAYYVCNPVNEEWKLLPPPNYFHQFKPAVVLAFEPSELNFNADFKVVCAFQLIDVPVIYFEIYSSEERSWKCSTTSCIELGYAMLKHGLYMNKTAYWETSTGQILAFDMKNELCGILPLPPQPNGGVLAQMRGELCYIKAYNRFLTDYVIEIYGGMDMSLKHSYPVMLGNVEAVNEECQVLPCVNGNVVVIFAGGTVYSYHLRDRKVEIVCRNKVLSERYLPYVNSLVSVAPKS